MEVKLNQRLKTIASLVEDNKSIIDVGCDHALLSIYLAKNNNAKKVIASDIKEGPLQNAKENIKKYKAEDIVIPKLGKGIDTIDTDTDLIIISGMGGLNMIGILKYCKDKYKQVDTIILSPNNYTYEVRKEICKLGFYIDDEVLIKDKNIIYPIIVFKRGKKIYKYQEYLYGPVLIKKKNNLFYEYLNKEKENKEKLLKVLPNKYILKKYQLKKELHLINKIV